VDIELPGRAKQRRWTVLIRGILAIPIAVVTIIVAIGTFFCAIVGWFAALFTGRAPQFLRTIVSLLLLLNLRLQAYSLLMTDRFPPLGFGDEPDYRVAVAAPPATKLNRWAVAFRIILVIPANIVVTLATYGIALLSIAGWVNALVTGWLPRTFHDAYRAFLRYADERVPLPSRPDLSRGAVRRGAGAGHPGRTSTRTSTRAGATVR
jgi:hypothetical protein